MADQTVTWGLPYPQDSDPVQVAQDIERLARETDRALNDLQESFPDPVEAIPGVVASISDGSANGLNVTATSPGAPQVLLSVPETISVSPGHIALLDVNISCRWKFGQNAAGPESDRAGAWLQISKDGGAFADCSYPYPWGAYAVGPVPSGSNPTHTYESAQFSHMQRVDAGDYRFQLVGIAEQNPADVHLLMVEVALRGLWLDVLNVSNPQGAAGADGVA